MVDYAKFINDNLIKKRYFMIWGICLGMHTLIGTITMKKELTFVDNDVKLHQESGEVINEGRMSDVLSDKILFKRPIFYFNHN